MKKYKVDIVLFVIAIAVTIGGLIYTDKRVTQLYEYEHGLRIDIEEMQKEKPEQETKDYTSDIFTLNNKLSEDEQMIDSIRIGLQNHDITLQDLQEKINIMQETLDNNEIYYQPKVTENGTN